MKRIKMLRDAPGSEELTGVTKTYEKDTEHTVSDALADGFRRLGGEPACVVLSDTDEDELLGRAPHPDPVLTEDALDEAAKRMHAGEYNMEYVVANMSSYFKADPVDLRARLTERLEKMKTPPADKNERQRTRTK